MKKKKWNEYLWIATIIYLILGLFHILFAWLGLICFALPLLISIFGGGKAYCNRYCGRGQLLEVLGNRFHLSSNRDIPHFLRKKWFRYGFLVFFMLMFFSMCYQTYLVFCGAANLKEIVTLFWTIKIPWGWAYHKEGLSWVAQFAFGFYSLMLTSSLLGFFTMILFKPRSWCVYCPMGTMTQGICQLKAGKEEDEEDGRGSKSCCGVIKSVSK